MEKDAAEKILADYNDVFADIANVLLFGGKRLIREDDLDNVKDRSMYKADGKVHEQERDLAKIWKDKHIRIAFVGMENQTDTDTNMPLRVMGYDGAAYRSQCLTKKSEKEEEPKKEEPKYPVITMVLYFGTKSHWKKGRKLSDCFPVPEELKPYFSDYKINVFEIAYLSDEQVNMFTSDFKIVADYCVQVRKNKKYKPSRETIKHVDEVLKLLNVLTGDDRFLLAQQKEEGGKTNMSAVYSVLDDVENRGIEKGRQEALRESAQIFFSNGGSMELAMKMFGGLSAQDLRAIQEKVR